MFLWQIIMPWKAEFWDVVYIKIHVYEIPIFRWLHPIICKIRSMQLHICVPWVKPVWKIEVWRHVKKKYNKDTKERKNMKRGVLKHLWWKWKYYILYRVTQTIGLRVRIVRLRMHRPYCWWVNLHQTLERYLAPCATSHVLNCND